MLARKPFGLRNWHPPRPGQEKAGGRTRGAVVVGSQCSEQGRWWCVGGRVEGEKKFETPGGSSVRDCDGRVTSTWSVVRRDGARGEIGGWCGPCNGSPSELHHASKATIRMYSPRSVRKPKRALTASTRRRPWGLGQRPAHGHHGHSQVRGALGTPGATRIR